MEQALSKEYPEEHYPDIKILVACEESQTVCTAFRSNGFEAYSCDLEPQTGGHPEWHIQSDVLSVLDGRTEFETTDGITHQVPYTWDLIIAHPPCTYMSAAGACRMYPQKGVLNPERFAKAMEAKEFFLRVLHADCKHICVENPRPLRVVELPEESQTIQPYQFGEPWSKLTYLWLNGLPPLEPTEYVADYKPYVSCGTSRNKGNKDKSGFSRAGGASRVRSRTFPGIAEAMTKQWGAYILEEKKCEDAEI